MNRLIRFILLILVLCVEINSLKAVAGEDFVQFKKREIIFSQKSYPINAINPTTSTNLKGSFFPGLRGVNQMVIYTQKYGKRTNTNEFGSEAIVHNNVITSISGADSVIPKNGFVISTHGIAKKWLTENVIVGSKVGIDWENKMLNVYLTSESFIYCSKEKIKEANEMIEHYSLKIPVYNKKIPEAHLKKAREYVRKAERSPKNVQKYSSMAIEEANKALEKAIPYDANELKGVWIRPAENSVNEIENTLDEIQNMGIKNVFLETFFHGYTIFPSYTMERYGFQVQNPKFKNFDPLRIWIDEAHKRQMHVHIWFETFYVGNNNPTDNPSDIVAVKPYWANVTKKNYKSEVPTPSYSEHNGYFLDPANPDVQTFLQALIQEIITNYKPDGINLDYIRYPQSVSASLNSYDMSNWGYTQFAREEFLALFGIDPVKISANSSSWDIWCRYRQDKIIEFVKKISEITKPNNVELTTVIFPDRKKALETKQQDWKTWAEAGYVDGLTPLILTCDAKTAKVMLQDVLNNKNRKTKVYAGLFITFMGGAEEDLIRQIHETRKVNAQGVILFDYAHIQNKYVKALNISAFNEKSPTNMEVLKKNKNKNKIKIKKTEKENEQKG